MPNNGLRQGLTRGFSRFPQGAVTLTFSATGAAQLFTVPAGVTSIRVDVSGARGGRFSASGVESTAVVPGSGAAVAAAIAVIPNEVLQINVGTNATVGVEGWNGGGAGATSAGWGGGASDIRRSPYALTDRLIIGAGGGGAGANGGGAGGAGGLIGANGTAFGSSGGGGGGQAASGGTAGSGGTGQTAGALGVGGIGSTLDPVRGGAGGGGGLYGGGGGGGVGGSGTAGGGGGGGSSLVPAGGAMSGTNPATGRIIITY